MSRQRDLPDSGIGRRDFLRVFGGSIATAASTPLSAVVVEDDVYINRKLGLAFSKPTDWSYASLRVFRELRNEYELATSDPVLVADFEEGGLPLAVISERSLRLGLSGSITVGVEPFDIEPTDTVQSVFTEIIEYYQEMFRGFEVIEPPTLRKVSNVDSVEFAAEFLYDRKWRRSVLCRNRTLYSFRDPFIYTFHMMDMPVKGIDRVAEFESFMGSIRYV